MKKFVFLSIFSALFASCNMTEKVYINEDNSVKYAYDMDLSQVSPMLAMGGNTEELQDKFPLDTVMTVKDFFESDLLGENNKDDLKDKAIFDIFKGFNVHLKLNHENGLFSFITEQKNMSDLNSVLKNMGSKIKKYEAKQSKDEAGQEFDKAFTQMFQTPTLSFDGKTFTRSGKVDLSYIDEIQNEEQGMGMMAMSMFGAVRYKSEYHFPRPVKSVSDSTILTSWDRKTIYIEKPISELLNNNQAYNFTVELED